MRITTLASTLALALTASSQLVVPYIDVSALSELSQTLPQDTAQRISARRPASDPDLDATSGFMDPTTASTQQTISDHLGALKSINIFSSLTRDVHTVNTRLESSGSTGAGTTLLCPLNTAMTALGRKPWQADPSRSDTDGHGVANALSGHQADENLRRFVEAHVVVASPWREADRVRTMAGDEVWWVGGGSDGEKRVIMPAGVEVESVQKRAGNGEIWVVRGVLA